MSCCCNMDKSLEAAARGREYWLERRLDEYDTVLLLPHADAELNALLLQSLRTRLTQGGAVRAAVLAVEAVEVSPLYDVEIISGELARCILSLYTLYAYTDKLIVGSFTWPAGRKLNNLLQSGVATAQALADTVVSVGARN